MADDVNLRFRDYRVHRDVPGIDWESVYQLRVVSQPDPHSSRMARQRTIVAADPPSQPYSLPIERETGNEETDVLAP